MPPDSLDLYANGSALSALLRRELAMLTSVLEGVYGVWGLHMRPHGNAPGVLPNHLLSEVINLALRPDGSLDGAARCEPAHLPFASESFKLVIAQHTLEQAAQPQESAAEFARVIAPEGVGLVFGFNPVSLWRPWLSRRLPADCQFRSAAAWREELSRARLDVLQVRYAGPWSPRSAFSESLDDQKEQGQRSFGRFGASWLVLARKRRHTLTPLRLAAVRSDLKLKPTLAPGARRECA